MLCLIDEIKGKEGKRFKIHNSSYSITYKVVAFFYNAVANARHVIITGIN